MLCLIAKSLCFQRHFSHASIGAPVFPQDFVKFVTKLLLTRTTFGVYDYKVLKYKQKLSTDAQMAFSAPERDTIPGEGSPMHVDYTTSEHLWTLLQKNPCTEDDLVAGLA